jgi:CheY-like chemotaxis protein
VPTAERAIELIETRPFDILVSDIALPGQDGHDLIRAVRARHPSLPAIAVTAFARPEDRQRALATGYDLHLPKPIDPDRLIEAVANLVIGAVPSFERRDEDGAHR